MSLALLSFFFLRDPVLSCCYMSLFLGKRLCVTDLVVVLGSGVARDEVSLQNDPVLTRDVCDLIHWVWSLWQLVLLTEAQRVGRALEVIVQI